MRPSVETAHPHPSAGVRRAHRQRGIQFEHHVESKADSRGHRAHTLFVPPNGGARLTRLSELAEPGTPGLCVVVRAAPPRGGNLYCGSSPPTSPDHRGGRGTGVTPLVSGPGTAWPSWPRTSCAHRADVPVSAPADTERGGGPHTRRAGGHHQSHGVSPPSLTGTGPTITCTSTRGRRRGGFEHGHVQAGSTQPAAAADASTAAARRPG